MKNKVRALCLMGPTAAGKTELALSLIEHLPLEIVSVDSAMIYRRMNIGTSKPAPALLKKIPHHLVNIREPYENYSAADFREDALQTLQDIYARGKTPFLVGGTMLYFRVLQQGLAELPGPNEPVRARILNEAKELGWHAMHQRLAKVDAIAAKRIHPNDPQRLQRALEVFEVTGEPISSHWQRQTHDPLPFQFMNLATAPSDRAVLHQRIVTRFHQMLSDGFIEEVKGLQAEGKLTADMPSMRSVGYRQVWKYLQGRYTHDELIEQGVIATRQLAKRQLTWLRSWQGLEWLESEDPQRLSKALRWADEALSS